ncbi:RNA-binding protein Nova-2 [Trichinella nelsoni]|uniref:RNA-binding protein Nova-2 n=1 Tax=Trichinella nelsoni TaxID=6336 RepID=A0A0V0SBF6_9BILA|nr:RNA-binding protein Nova-2 [Trichinella nelsoni]
MAENLGVQKIIDDVECDIRVQREQNVNSSSLTASVQIQNSTVPNHGDEGCCEETRKAEKCSEQQVMIKVLIPRTASGAVIGRNGSHIASLKRKSLLHQLKMSKPSELFPGTTERVLLIAGPLSSVVEVIQFTMTKIQEQQAFNTKPDEFDFKHANRSSQVKLVIANSSAGVIIGKAGEEIRVIKEETHAQVKVSSRTQSVAERVVTILGADEAITLAALRVVLNKVAADPNSTNNGRISYGQPQAPAPAPSSVAGLDLVAAMVTERVRAELVRRGYSQPAVVDVVQAVNVMLKYELIGCGLDLEKIYADVMAAYSSQVEWATTPTPLGYCTSHYSSCRNVNLPSLVPCAYSEPLALTVVQAGRKNSTFDNETFMNRHHYHSQQQQQQQQQDQEQQLLLLQRQQHLPDNVLRVQLEGIDRVELEVVEWIVGAVLGKNGFTLLDIQRRSGAKVEVSRRGTVQNAQSAKRLIIITGQQTSILQARALVCATVAAELSRRKNRQQQQQPASFRF